MIINLTQHTATEEQTLVGVVEPDDKKRVQELLTFAEMPSAEEIVQRAEALADIALSAGVDAAMIGGAPFLMGALERALKSKGIAPLYAFSTREVVEVDDGHGGVKKTAIFRHLGFVRV